MLENLQACFNLALTERNMQVRFGFKLSVYSLGLPFDLCPLNSILVSWDGLNSLEEKGLKKTNIIVGL